MNASQQGIGAPFVYKGPRQLLLYDDPGDLAPREDGEPAPKPVAQALLPLREDRALLVFAFAKKNQGAPSVQVYGIDTNGMKNGDYRLFNFSKQAVYAVIGNNQKTALKPRQNSLLSSSKWRKDILDLDIQFATPDRWQTPTGLYLRLGPPTPTTHVRLHLRPPGSLPTPRHPHVLRSPRPSNPPPSPPNSTRSKPRSRAPAAALNHPSPASREAA